MNTIAHRLTTIQQQINNVAEKAGREPADVGLLAVSKTHAAAVIEEAWLAGLTDFGESYLQEAVEKMASLQFLAIQWHFIGRIQSNKTRIIAEHFDWVHSLYQTKHAQRLNDQRPPEQPPLKVCLQVNISQDPNKGGLLAEDLSHMITTFEQWPRLSLQGLMALPTFTQDIKQQRQTFSQMRELRDREASIQYPLATLSMGMSGDFEQAIMEGSNLVRIGSALFGKRQD